MLSALTSLFKLIACLLIARVIGSSAGVENAESRIVARKIGRGRKNYA
jgi:hypothetical protein